MGSDLGSFCREMIRIGKTLATGHCPGDHVVLVSCLLCCDLPAGALPTFGELPAAPASRPVITEQKIQAEKTGQS